MKEGLTFKTVIGFDDIEKQFQLLYSRQRETILLLMNGEYGIVSKVDTDSLSSPLYPTLTNNVLYFYKGDVITKNGDYVQLESFSITVPFIKEDTLVLYVYEQVGSKEKRITNDGTVASVWFDKKDTVESIKFVTPSQYNSLLDSIKGNSVCLCVLKYYNEGIQLDLTKNQYEYNRPLFSPCDIAHRNKIGTGSSLVPHSIGINDLTSSNLTLYNQLLSRGIIISKDVGIPGIPGKLYEYQGKVSYSTKYGNHIKLECFPNAIGSATLEDKTDVACHLIKGTNIVVIDEALVINTVVILHTVITSALMPPNPNELGEFLSFTSSEETDIIITQGYQTNIVDNTLSFSDCGNIPRTYEVVFSEEGRLQKEPNVLGYVSSIPNMNAVYNREFSIPVQVQIAIDSLLQPGETVEFIVTGMYEKDEVVETIVFNSDTYSPNLTGFEHPVSMARTNKFFNSITSITSNSNNNGTATVYTLTHRAKDRRTRVALVEWDGNTINSETIKDIRPISTTISDPLNNNTYVVDTCLSLLSALNLYDINSGLKQNHLIFADSFFSPDYLDTNTVSWRTTPTGMNFPIIPSYTLDSSSFTNCYRSRVFLATNPFQSNYQSFVVYLPGADKATQDNSTVRITFWDDNNERNERLLISIGNGLFLGKLKQTTPKKVQFTVSGKASGMCAMLLSNNNLSNYEV